MVEDAEGETYYASMARGSSTSSILFGIYGVVPEAMLRRVEIMLGTGLLAQLQLSPSTSNAATLPPSRIRRLLKNIGVLRTPRSELYGQCPDLLLAAWNSGTKDNQEAAARHLKTLITTNYPRIRGMLTQWPQELVARALARASSSMQSQGCVVPLQLLLRVQDEPMAEHAWLHLLFMCEVTPAEVDRFLRFAQKQPTERVLIAVCRLHEVDARGRKAALQLVNELLAHEDLTACWSALSLALRLNLNTCNWRPAADRVTDVKRSIAEAAHVKFGDMSIMDCDHPAVVIATLHAEVDIDTLRQKTINFAYLVAVQLQLPEVTAAAALILFGEQPQWSEQETRAVLDATLSEFAGVRHAAYAALTTRDRELWPSAWLAYEATLDHDPSVHSVAPDAELAPENK